MRLSVPLFVTMCLSVASPVSATAQINKELVDRAPREEWAPMPHVDPEDPDRPLISRDESLNMWRSERDPARNPQRAPGPIDIQRYDIQLEPVGVKTFYQLPLALTPEDLVAGKVDVAIFGHLHLACPTEFANPVGTARGVRYYLASADFIDFTPVPIG